MAQLPTDAESLRRIESSIKKLISEWDQNANPIVEAYRDLEQYILNRDVDRLGTWTAEDRQRADQLPQHRDRLVVPDDLKPYLAIYTDDEFSQLDDCRIQALEGNSNVERVRSILADLIEAGDECQCFIRRRRESSEQPKPPKSGVRRTERDRIVTAYNIAHECLGIVWKFLLIAEAPAVERAEPEFAEGVRSDVQGFGWNQALRQPLEASVERSKPRRVGHLRSLHTSADKEFVHKWNAWSDSANELAIVIARDLWKVVQRCEKENGSDAAWGHYALRDGLLFERLREEWRFRDIPIERLCRCQLDELIAWERSNKQPASLAPATTPPVASPSGAKPAGLDEEQNTVTTAPAAPNGERTTVDLTDEEKAIALAMNDHGLSVSDIASNLGVDRKTPYRWEKFMAIFKGLQGLNAGNAPTRGSKDRDGNLEAEDDSE